MNSEVCGNEARNMEVFEIMNFTAYFKERNGKKREEFLPARRVPDPFTSVFKMSVLDSLSFA